MYSRIVLVFILADLKQNFNHVLNALLNVGLVQNITKLVKDKRSNCDILLFDVLTDLFHQAYRDFDAVIGRLVEQKQQDLGYEHLMQDLLIDEMSKKCGTAETDVLVVPAICLFELGDQSVHEQLPDLRQLAVDNGHHGSTYRCKGQMRSLCLHDTSAE